MSMERSNINFSSLTVPLFGAAVLSLVYLMILDLIFVLVLNEKQSWLNTLPLGVFLLPVVCFFIGFKAQEKYKYLLAVIGAIFGLVVAYLQLLWVATSFHTMLGGSI
tara:strand:+ start:897 stop:1217 length:321 start_codon:yes stop_codon:yes gene_type:complete